MSTLKVDTLDTRTGSGNITVSRPLSGSGASLTNLNGSNIASGTVPTARLGSGTANNGVFLRGDNTWAAAGGGKVLQVVSTTKTDTFTSTSGTSWTDITGLSVAVTPSATSSKILVCWNLALGTAANNNVYCRLLRGSTAISVGDSAGSRNQSTGGGVPYANYGWAGVIAGTYLDSPSTTSATTYKIQLAGQASVTLCVNRNENNGNHNYSVGRTASTITVMEIGA